MTSDDVGATLIEIDHDAIDFTVTGNGAQTVSLTSLTSPLNDGQWHHIVVTYDVVDHRLHVFVDVTRVTDAAGLSVTAQSSSFANL